MLLDSLDSYPEGYVPCDCHPETCNHIDGMRFVGTKKKHKLTVEQMMKLAEIYKTNRVCVAQVCDEVLDRSGGLLGEIREISNKIKI